MRKYGVFNRKYKTYNSTLSMIKKYLRKTVTVLLLHIFFFVGIKTPVHFYRNPSSNVHYTVCTKKKKTENFNINFSFFHDNVSIHIPMPDCSSHKNIKKKPPSKHFPRQRENFYVYYVTKVMTIMYKI